MKLLYKPFGILFSVLGGILASAVFKQIWKGVADEEDAPSATESEYSWKEVLIAAGIQGATYGVVKAAIDRGGAVWFKKTTGAWPGD